MDSLAATAHDLGDAIGRGWPDGDRVRLLAQAVEAFDALGGRDEQDAFLLEPATTGDIVWDAALAALAVHLCRRAGMATTPAWTRQPERYAPRFHWIGLAEGSTLQAYVFQRTPAYFKVRGVLLDERNLVSV